MEYQERRDEIDLVDIWNIVAQHVRVVVVTAVIGSALGVVYAFAKPQVYGYRTVIEIGMQLVNNESRPIDKPESLRTKISEAYGPVVMRDFYSRHPEIEVGLSFDVTTPKDSNLIVIQHEKPRDLSDEVAEIHATLVGRILDDHERVIALIRDGLESEIKQTENRLEKQKSEQALLENELERLQLRHEGLLAILEEKIALAKSELGRLDELQVLVKAQIVELQELISQAMQNRQQAISGVNEASAAMTLMLINDELQRNQNLLADLRERQAVGIPNQRSKYEQQIQELQNEKMILASELSDQRGRFIESIRDVERRQSETLDAIEGLELKLQNLSDTHALVVASESLLPVGLGKAVIILLAAVGSMMFGLMLVFFIHFYQLANSRKSAADR